MGDTRALLDSTVHSAWIKGLHQLTTQQRPYLKACTIWHSSEAARPRTVPRAPMEPLVCAAPPRGENMPRTPQAPHMHRGQQLPHLVLAG